MLFSNIENGVLVPGHKCSTRVVTNRRRHQLKLPGNLVFCFAQHQISAEDVGDIHQCPSSTVQWLRNRRGEEAEAHIG